MPAPRNNDPARNGDKWTGHTVLHAAAIPSGRPYTGAEAQRRHRRGIRTGYAGGPPLIFAAVRNGMPEFRPYVYRGTGADAFTGEVVL